jgi:NAD(P)-dependent dehydrogenase (short-subunit alcohol dehydrogenase family)
MAAVLITGGTRGIGAAAAAELLGAGHRVTVTGRAEQAPPSGAAYRSLELADRDSVARLGAELVADPPDVLVHNAGTGVFGPLTSLSDDDIERVIAVNLTGAIQLTRRLLEGWQRAGRGGRVIHVGSIVERLPVADCSVYAASKGGLHVLSRSLGAEFRGSGISFTQLSLGAVFTDIWRERGGFSASDMLAVSDVARVLRFLVETPPHVRIDELCVDPPKGLL